jgi:hypothetical protein
LVKLFCPSWIGGGDERHQLSRAEYAWSTHDRYVQQKY